MTLNAFVAAPYHLPEDPLDRVLGYIAYRRTTLTGEIAEFTCLVGTMVQETYATHPALREASERHLDAHVGVLARDIEFAKARHAPAADWSAEGLATHIQAVLQGGFIIAKIKNGAAPVVDALDHLRRYIELLFAVPSNRGK
jgi:TetR/AcrR family transcriptional repressor of nem operon